MSDSQDYKSEIETPVLSSDTTSRNLRNVNNIAIYQDNNAKGDTKKNPKIKANPKNVTLEIISFLNHRKMVEQIILAYILNM